MSVWFSYRNARVNKLWSHDHIYNIIWITWWNFGGDVIGIMTSKPLFQNNCILRRTGVANFANIIKIVTVFIKRIFKDSKNVKRTRNYVPKCSLYLYFLLWQNFLIFDEEMLMSAELKESVTWFKYFFGSSLVKV